MTLYKGIQPLTDVDHIEGLQSDLDTVALNASNALTAQSINRQFLSWRWVFDADRDAQTGMRHGDLGWMTDRRGFRYSGTEWLLTEQPETTFVPTVAGGVSVNNGSSSATVSVHAGLAIMSHKVFLGSTSVVGGALRFNLPHTSPSARYIFGHGRMYDSSAALYYDAHVMIQGNVVWLYPVVASTGYSTIGGVTGSVPFTWAAGDHFEYTVSWALPGVGV